MRIKGYRVAVKTEAGTDLWETSVSGTYSVFKGDAKLFKVRPVTTNIERVIRVVTK